jgi:hypothetical protein
MMFRNLFAKSLALALMLGACSKPEQASGTKVSDVDHSFVKRQAVGNCWLYAAASWAESLHKSATGEIADLSESYWTYWHWYDQVVDSGITEISTGGHWGISTRIILEHGYLYESEFIAVDEGREMSETQAAAEAYMNAALQVGGELEDPSVRTPQNVKRVLNAAFGVDIDEASTRAYDASTFVTSSDGLTLRDSLVGPYAWRSVSYPTIYDESQAEFSRARRDAVMKRALRAVNDYWPVVISIHIDFNGLDSSDATFKYDLLQQNGIGTQGGHMVVLEDYAVDNVPDGQGGFMSIEEGDVSPELKEMALQGDVRYLVAKNSWGTNRLDRGLTDGYTRFDADYMNLPMEREGGYRESALRQFILPPGY